jgi:hypothetical protein
MKPTRARLQIEARLQAIEGQHAVRGQIEAYRPTSAQYDARVDRIIGMPGATRNNLLRVAERDLDRIERRERSRRGAQEILAVCITGMIIALIAVGISAALGGGA